MGAVRLIDFDLGKVALRIGCFVPCGGRCLSFASGVLANLASGLRWEEVK